MSEVGPWQFDLEDYIREGEPDRVRRADAWQTAIGLQAVDGLATSAYLQETAREHIEGAISIDEAQRRVQSYYEARELRNEVAEEDTKEADIVSSRIARLLGERAFTFSPAQLKLIHLALFEGLLPTAGEFRTYNITKKEAYSKEGRFFTHPRTLLRRLWTMTSLARGNSRIAGSPRRRLRATWPHSSQAFGRFIPLLRETRERPQFFA